MGLQWGSLLHSEHCSWGYNVGPQAVFSITSGTIFVLNLTVAGLAAGGAGTVTNNGNISAGVHKVSLVFKTGKATLPLRLRRFNGRLLWQARGYFQPSNDIGNSSECCRADSSVYAGGAILFLL